MGTTGLGLGLCCLLDLTRILGVLLSITMGQYSGFFEAVMIYWVKACFIDKTILLILQSGRSVDQARHPKLNEILKKGLSACRHQSVLPTKWVRQLYMVGLGR